MAPEKDVIVQEVNSAQKKTWEKPEVKSWPISDTAGQGGAGFDFASEQS